VSFKDIYQGWKSDPEGFWMKAAEDIDWVKPPSKALWDDDAPIYEWFKDAQVNTCYNAVDRHVVSGYGDQTAIIYDSPVTNKKSKTSYLELQTQVAAFAGGLAAKGITVGDRVIIYMPMVPEALIAMLACARIGAIHSVVFGGFAANELAVRIDDATPKAIISGSCGVESDRIVEYDLNV
jgi:propionyl-CoA synthetase